jgi:hypothetical protein
MTYGTPGSIVSLCSMLQAGGVPSFNRVFVIFINLRNPSSRIMVLVLTKPLTKMSTKNLPWGKGVGGEARTALTTSPPSVESIVSRQFQILDVSQPYRSPRTVTGITLLYFFI